MMTRICYMVHAGTIDRLSNINDIILKTISREIHGINSVSHFLCVRTLVNRLFSNLI